jgi:peptidoglycan hydrolase-like protein with peptidoglycan-binding domain
MGLAYDPSDNHLFVADTNNRVLVFNFIKLSATIPSASIGSAYSQTLSTGNQGTLSFALASGSLPPGLSLDTGTGVLSGTPTQTGIFSFGINATDTVSSVDIFSDSQTISITVNDAPTFPALSESSFGGGMPAEWNNMPKAPVGGFGISINNGAESTSIPAVILKLKGGPDTARMAISNFPDFRDAGQETYTSSTVWNLCWQNSILQTPSTCPVGTYAVYAKFYAPWGRSSETVSDTIIYKISNQTSQNPVENSSSQPFIKDLKFGQVSADVKRLQIFLNQNSDTKIANSSAGSLGKETTTFGYLTKAAVIKFQEKYASEILTPLGLKKGTGIVSKNTRAKINKILGF